MKKVRVVSMLFALLLLAACGAETATQAPEPTPAEEVAQQEEPEAEPTPLPEPTEESSVVSSLQDVRSATIRINSVGSFVSPQFGEQRNVPGSGSGFIIDPEGIAVTNNHVVTGAAFLEVYVEGEDDPRNARVLGVSECSDLAVIDIDGEGFPALAWYEGPIDVGMEIYAAGFPNWTEEFTLTRGIISKADAGGESDWASVDSVLEIDAQILGGNSGGPLVNGDGQVVGINYAGTDVENFSISRDEAIPVVEQLRSGQDVHSIGINGQAVTDGESLFGIWVNSVESGSPADRAGIEPGDIIESMEGLVLATDVTMSDYCDILRSRDPSDVISIEVVRFETQEVLEGQLNGEPLAPAFSFAQVVEEEAPAVADNDTTDAEQAYMTISDDFDAVVVDVPVDWADIDGSPWEDDQGIVGSYLAASPDLGGYLESFGVPGLEIWATNLYGDFSIDELVELLDFSESCTYDSRNDYADEIYTGAYDLYLDCGGGDTLIIVLAARPADGSHEVIMVGQVVTDDDAVALDRALATFNVVGQLPGN